MTFFATPFSIVITSGENLPALSAISRVATELNQTIGLFVSSTTLTSIGIGAPHTLGILGRVRRSFARSSIRISFSQTIPASTLTRILRFPGLSEASKSGISDSIASIRIFVCLTHEASKIYPPETSTSILWRSGRVGFQRRSLRRI